MSGTTVSLVLKEKVKFVDGKATETRNTQVRRAAITMWGFFVQPAAARRHLPPARRA